MQDSPRGGRRRQWRAVAIARLIEILLAPRGWRFSLLLAAALVGLSTVVRLWAHGFLGDNATYATYYWAVSLSAIVGGLRPAAIALVLSNLAVWWFFVEPHYTFAPLDAADAAQMAFFNATECLEAAFALALRGALRRLRARDRQLSLVAAELNHRVKNNLAIVISLVAQTARFTRDIPDFVSRLTPRIKALSKCNELITREHWGEVPLREIVATTLRPLAAAARVSIDGAPEDLAVSSRAAVSLSLIIHELATNAGKYGALSDEDGRLKVGWRRLDSAHGQLDWTETTTFATPPPGSSGFGTTLIRRLSGADLGGEATIDYGANGLHALIRFSLSGATA
jgi:two-component sensor histidine kinase